jgi:Glycosyl transferases group 1
VAAKRSHGDAQLVPGQQGNVLLLSMRRLADLVAFCVPYEFEDVFAVMTGADRVDAGYPEAMEFSRRVYKLARLATGSRRFARAIAPDFCTVRLEKHYELFFPVFNHAYELYALATLPDWRRRSRLAACFVSELWVQHLPKYLLEMLAEFDHVFVGVQHVVDEVSQIVGVPCHYLPLAADVLRFSPYPDLPARTIDVCNIGRRSEVTHAQLLGLARERRLFYYYDTVAASGPDRKQRTFRVSDPEEHRLLLANLLRRSRYYIANRSRVNEPEFTMGRDEISSRFYEGAAAGTVMLGEPPRTPLFEAQFDWPDALITLPFDSPEIARLLAELDADPKRLSRVQRSNVRNAALRHDWVHRVREVFKTLGLPPTAGMLAREERLRALAALAADAGAGRESGSSESAGMAQPTSTSLRAVTGPA